MNESQDVANATENVATTEEQKPVNDSFIDLSKAVDDLLLDGNFSVNAALNGLSLSAAGVLTDISMNNDGVVHAALERNVQNFITSLNAHVDFIVKQLSPLLISTEDVAANVPKAKEIITEA